MLLSHVRVILRGTVTAVLVVALQACGGGGGGSSNPVLGQLSFTTNENVALTKTLTATDPGGGQVTFSKTSDPASGAVSGFTAAGAFTYTPKPDFTGTDSFGVQAADSMGHMTPGTVSITVTVNQPPTAGNTIVRADGGALAGINVLGNANDPNSDPLTVTILDQPPTGAGTAVVNSDGSVSLTGLSGFKGMTHFTYQVADPSGATVKAGAAVFVGTDPFRAAFVGDAPGNGSNEVYLTDFAADPVVMTAATQGNLRLKAFAISDNGATIAYRVEDTTSAANTSLAFVKTAAPTQATKIGLPSGLVPVADGNGQDQFIVSPDGQWIAAIAGQGSLSSLYVLNISQPGAVSQIQPSGTNAAALPSFSLDSKSIYFLANGGTQGVHRSLYFASLASPGQTTLISDVSDPGTLTDDVSSYAVSPDQTRILLQAVRGGKSGLYFVAAQHPAVMNPLNDSVVGQSVGASTVGLPAGRGGSTTVARVAYIVQGAAVNHPAGIYVSDVSATPNPRLEIQSSTAQILGLRPDDQAFLFADQGEVSEAVIDTPGTQAVGGGYGGWYDSTGNIALLQVHLGSGPTYPALAATSRGQFGTASPVGTSSLAVAYSDVSGFDRGVAIIGQGPTAGTTATATLQLVNALAPQGLLPLAGSPGFQSPLQLTSYSSKIVSQ